LAWKTACQYIVVWYAGGIYFRDITMWLFAEVRLVGNLTIIIPLRRKDAFSANILKCNANAANTCE
jgi:hypothetical protein